MQNCANHLPLVTLSGCLALGILSAEYLAVPFYPLLIACLVALSVFCWRRSLLLLCLVFVCLGALRASSQFLPPETPRPRSEKPAIHTLVITAPVQFRRSGIRVDADFMDGAPTQLHLYEGVPHLRSGDIVRVTGRIKPVAGYRNPGARDRVRQAQRQGVDRVVQVKSVADVEVVGRAWGLWSTRKFEAWRFWIREFAVGARGPSPLQESGLIRALLIGDRSFLSDETTKAFQSAGLAHLLAISGQHIGMIALLSFFCFRLLLCLAPRFALLIPLQKLAWLLATIPTAAYVAVAGAPVSAVRAFILFLVFVFAFLIQRRRESWSALALAALIILLSDPSALFSLSFQLSFMAVAVLIVCMRGLGKGVRTWPLRVLIASAAITCVTAPLVSYDFQVIPLAGLLANFVAIPWVGFVVLPLSALSALAGTLVPALGAWVLQWASLAADGLIVAADFFADWDLTVSLALQPTQVWSCYVTIIVGIILWRSRRWFLSPPYKGGDLGEVFKVPVLICALIALVAAIRFSNSSPDQLQLTMLDVGQGDAMHLRLPNGLHYLVDGGGFYIPRDKRKFQVSDMGSRVVMPYLKRQGVHEIQGMILSHPHPDHYEGLLAVARELKVRHFYWSGDRFPDSSYDDLMVALRVQGTQFHRVHDMTPPIVDDDVTIHWLNPRVGLKANLNNRSLVMKLEYKNVCFILTGDIEAAAERRLAQQGEIDCDVLKVAHHGSRTSSRDDFLAQVNPQWALVSAGARNPFGHPHRQVISRYEQAGIHVLRTDQYGAITLSSNGSTIQLKAVASPESQPASRYQLRWRSQERAHQ